MIVYVAGKYYSDDYDEKLENLEQAIEVAKQLLQNNFVPVIPHRITFDFELDDRFEHWTNEDWLERFCFPLLDTCDALIISCGKDTSYGVKREVEYALDNGIPVFDDVEELICYLKKY